MKKITVHLKDRSYDILIGRGIIGSAGRLIKKLGIGNDAIVITNARIARLSGGALRRSLERVGISVRFELVPDSEKAKSSATALRVIDNISARDKSRRIFLIALGGGVVGDLTGFVAAVYRRGIPYVQIPTTLLAQVDSAIGGKTAIDLPVAKNLIGAFYQPRLVLSDMEVLRSLSKRQLACGLAEVIKYGVINDPSLFAYLESNISKIMRCDKKALETIVSRSSATKARYVQADELDRKGVRAALNYGHTIGHAIEAASGYSGAYGHGESVAVGMAAAAEISFWLGMLKIKDFNRIRGLIAKASLPTTACGLDPSRVWASHLHDKKFSGDRNRFILPKRIGRVAIVEGVPEFAIKAVLKKLLKT